MIPAGYLQTRSFIVASVIWPRTQAMKADDGIHRKYLYMYRSNNRGTNLKAGDDIYICDCTSQINLFVERGTNLKAGDDI
jgi:hypothetical protein